MIRTVDTLTLGVITGHPALLLTAVMECFIGITLVTGKLLLVSGLLVLGMSLVGIMSPLVLFFGDLFPGDADARGAVRGQGHRAGRCRSGDRSQGTHLGATRPPRLCS